MEPGGVIPKICRDYTGLEPVSHKVLGDGHINDSYLADTEDGKYVIQRLQRKMDIAKLEYNFNLYSELFIRNGILFPAFLRDRDGRLFYTDPDGDNWRIYPFIGGSILNPPLAKESLYECGRGLAKLHDILRKLPAKPAAVYPGLHDLKRYHEEYKELIRHGGLFEEERDPLLEEKIRSGIENFSHPDEDRTFVIHGDPKLSNILFREGKAAAFIDLDTVMTGSLAEDVADCVRSLSPSGKRPDRTICDPLLEGYAAVAGKSVTDRIREMLPYTVEKIVFELGLRYYTDAIAREKKFKEKYPGYRLERARRLLTES